jgi:putative transposase
MGIRNKISEGYLYYITITVVDWVDVFTRPVYKHLIIDSLKHCQKEKGLEIYAWCLMTNHIHLIAGASEGFHLSDILRDFKKYTSKKIIKLIQEEQESRREWMLYRFEYAAKFNNKIKEHKFWQDGNEPKEIHTNEFLDQKLNYIHNNPVESEIVYESQHYLFSSAIDYAGGKGLLDIIIVE